MHQVRSHAFGVESPVFPSNMQSPNWEAVYRTVLMCVAAHLMQDVGLCALLNVELHSVHIAYDIILILCCHSNFHI